MLVTFTLATCLAVSSGTPPETEVEMRNFTRELGAQEHAVRSELRDEALWQDPSRRERLLQCLRMAGALRVESLAPVLADHLDYSPTGDSEETHRLTVEARFPAFGALKRIGLPAVPALLCRLKADDPEDRLGAGQQVHNLAVLCLVAIYDQGGHGRELARRRIELESKEASPKEKEFLRKALEHPQIRDQSRE